jgi:hypothetical protein
MGCPLLVDTVKDSLAGPMAAALVSDKTSSGWCSMNLPSGLAADL